MAMDLSGKTCVVTGAARSIGLAVAEMYCKRGASVALIDILPEVEVQAERLSKEGFTAKGYVLNITDQDAVMNCFESIAADLGDVFTLANIAGAVDQQDIESMTPERIDRMMQINFNGTVYCVQGALKTMKNYGNGRIINFASKSGKTGSALMGAYSGAKGAIISLTHALAFELAGDQIKVNCLCPGIVDDTGVWSSVSKGYVENMKMEKKDIVDKFTAKIPLQRLCTIDDIVAWCEFLTIHGDYNTGQAFNVSGGREVH
jgi:NAD(P)-dependent dehydrogenase (short-subunit alcohol dehydrogenase family)